MALDVTMAVQLDKRGEEVVLESQCVSHYPLSYQ